MDKKVNISLFELQCAVRECIEGEFPGSVRVKAEISELKVNFSGHCYMTLVEKDPSSGTVKAKAQAIVWASAWRLVKAAFESATGQSLKAGMEILAEARVQYSEIYSLSLIIYDIDASFSIGQMELARRKTIKRLESEGMMEKNSQLKLPWLPRRFAVISSETAAGWRDFRHHLLDNEYGYTFSLTLFPAVMQGDEAPQSIIAALEAAASAVECFDAVLILRGGGGAMDLVCFDDYDLAVNIAQFPLPVLTGIGHDHDYHVADMVAHTYVKTPTALADLLVDIFAQEEFRLDTVCSRLKSALESRSAGRMASLDAVTASLRRAVASYYERRELSLRMLELRLNAADPRKALERGHALVFSGGRRVCSAAGLRSGDEAALMFKDGNVRVKVL